MDIPSATNVTRHVHIATMPFAGLVSNDVVYVLNFIANDPWVRVPVTVANLFVHRVLTFETSAVNVLVIG